MSESGKTKPDPENQCATALPPAGETPPPGPLLKRQYRRRSAILHNLSEYDGARRARAEMRDWLLARDNIELAGRIDKIRELKSLNKVIAPMAVVEGCPGLAEEIANKARVVEITAPIIRVW